jgi:hypothetical protein
MYSLQCHANSFNLVRRVKKPVTQALPGDQVEIITRPDGTKVRRIRRAKKPESSDSNASQIESLESFLGSAAGSMSGSSATVAGDYAEGEIYIRADGKKCVSWRFYLNSLDLQATHIFRLTQSTKS